ncbi:MAG: hypothetical protein J6V80_00920 [Clostridia bacterium]|nr:hypothetical protein [Clostridia bacterium]
MRKVLVLLIIVVIFSSFSVKSHADERVDEYISEFEDILPEGYEGLGESEKLIEAVDLGSLLSEIITSLSGGRADIVAFFLTLLGSVALMSVASLSHERLSPQTQGVVGIICSVGIFTFLHPLIGSVGDNIGSISRFFASLIPVAVGLTALGGGVAGASAQSAGMYTALSCVGGIGGEIFLSLSSFGLALCLISTLGGEGISSVIKGLRSLFGWICGLFTALITAAFALQTLVASSADSASMRAVKYAASGLIPVVGSTVSSAISTLASGVSYAKGIVGGGAIIVILYMAISPLVMLLCYRLALTLGVILSDFCGVGIATKMLSSYRFALDMTVTVYALSALIYLFEIIIFIKTGVALS